MTFLDKLQSHKGGLIQLKTQLCWREGRRWDNNPGRICLILDAVAAAAATTAAAAEAAAARTFAGRSLAAALLLIDGKPQWVWLAEQDIDLLVNDPPTN